MRRIQQASSLCSFLRMPQFSECSAILFYRIWKSELFLSGKFYRCGWRMSIRRREFYLPVNYKVFIRIYICDSDIPAQYDYFDICSSTSKSFLMFYKSVLHTDFPSIVNIEERSRISYCLDWIWNPFGVKIINDKTSMRVE